MRGPMVVTVGVVAGVGFVVAEMWGPMVLKVGVVAGGIGMGCGWVGNLNPMSWASFQCQCAPVLAASVVLFSLNSRYLRNNKMLAVDKLGTLHNMNNKQA